MKINELIREASDLVAAREIIDHGSIRCLWSQAAVDSIESAEGCEKVGTGLVGDDDLAAELSELAGDGDRIADLEIAAIVALEDVYRGADITDYIDAEAEDELTRLDQFIDAARELLA